MPVPSNWRLRCTWGATPRGARPVAAETHEAVASGETIPVLIPVVTHDARAHRGIIACMRQTVLARAAIQVPSHPVVNGTRILTRRVQAVCARSPASFSDGVMYRRVLRGRPLRLRAMRARSAAEWTDRSVPLGRYWRSSPLVFSFEPR